MSLIEQALRRARNTQEADPATPSRRLIRRAPVVTAETAPSRVYAKASLNQAALQRSSVMPYLQDDFAQRAYKVLRTRVLKRLEANRWRSVAVTSAAPGDGKSLTAMNLAIALAQDSSTSVFLVDMDLQRPSLARYMGIEHGPGISQFLAGEARADEIVYDVGIDRLAVVPNGQALHNSSDLLSSDRMGELTNFLEAETPRRVIVYDMPPALVGDDVMAFAKYFDSVLLVVSEGKTARVALENARNVVAEMNLIGVVFNQATQMKDEAYAYY